MEHIYICVNEGQKLSEYRVCLTEGRKKKKKKKEKIDRVWFSRKAVVLDCRTMSSGSISRVDNNGEV